LALDDTKAGAKKQKNMTFVISTVHQKSVKRGGGGFEGGDEDAAPVDENTFATVDLVVTPANAIYRRKEKCNAHAKSTKRRLGELEIGQKIRATVIDLATPARESISSARQPSNRTSSKKKNN